MNDYALPAGYAVLTWWFMTGIILFLDGLPRGTFRWSMAVASLVLCGALYFLVQSAADTGAIGAYIAFTSAVLIWGWLEMSFLMGFITGPRKTSCADACSGIRHFAHATFAIIYHELATLAGGIIVLALTWHSPNRFGLWTFLVLWGMRLSAKLNLFLGVLNSGEQFLPDHLKYLKGFFRKRRMNVLFPFSILASTTLAFWLAGRCVAAANAGQFTGFVLVTSLLGLAVLEHCLMVVPVRIDRLWSWAMRPSSAVGS